MNIIIIKIFKKKYNINYVNNEYKTYEEWEKDCEQKEIYVL